MENIKQEKRKKAFELLALALGMAVFALGFLSASLIYSYSDTSFEQPNIADSKSAVYAPHDIVSEDKIKVYDDRIVINVRGASLSNYAPTGSMKPLFDKGANGIRIVPDNEEDIHIGDIISFKGGGELIVHRVVQKGFDDSGAFFVTKGDNNYALDEKIRFSDIKFVTIGVIY